MGIFDNASSVVINNKEVQSIVRVSDGAVLYQKAQSHSYALAFSSATYQTDSSGDVTVSVTLTDNGVAVSGETVSFSDGSSVYTGITNNSGIATLTLSGLTSNITVTASFESVTDTCTITVPTKKATTFYVRAREVYLRDSDGIGLVGKTVICTTKSGTYTVVTGQSGYVDAYEYRALYVFEGDSEYEGCTYQ